MDLSDSADIPSMIHQLYPRSSSSPHHLELDVDLFLLNTERFYTMFSPKTMPQENIH